MITADHGNAEMMIDPVTKGPHTYHTTNPVPFILVDETRAPLRTGGALQDISPTILGFLGEKQPQGNDRKGSALMKSTLFLVLVGFAAGWPSRNGLATWACLSMARLEPGTRLRMWPASKLGTPL